MFNKTDGLRSPVSQDFIWVGEYFDGTHLPEYDFVTKQENAFYSIDRTKLIRFGLVGHGMKLYFESGGAFNLNGTCVEVAYKVGEKIYPLTGHFGKYKDIITYKDADSSLLMNGRVINTINQYNFGYKTELEMEDVKFNFKAICTIPFEKPAYINFRLVANQELDGVFVIKRNNRVIEEIPAKLSENVGGELNWIVR